MQLHLNRGPFLTTLVCGLVFAGGFLVSSSRDQIDPVSWANSLASSPARFSFVVVGDTQDDGTTGGGINDNIWPQMATDMNALSPAFALFCGDLISGSGSMNTTLAEWQAWDSATSSLHCPRLMTPGKVRVHFPLGQLNSPGFLPPIARPERKGVPIGSTWAMPALLVLLQITKPAVGRRINPGLMESLRKAGTWRTSLYSLTAP